ERAIDRSGRLREHRVVAWPAATADGAAAAMEKPQPHAVRLADVAQALGRLVERPVGGDVAAVLVAVRIAEHHFLLGAAARHPLPIERQLERRGHYAAAVLE